MADHILSPWMVEIASEWLHLKDTFTWLTTNNGFGKWKSTKTPIGKLLELWVTFILTFSLYLTTTEKNRRPRIFRHFVSSHLKSCLLTSTKRFLDDFAANMSSEIKAAKKRRKKSSWSACLEFLGLHFRFRVFDNKNI